MVAMATQLWDIAGELDDNKVCVTCQDMCVNKETGIFF